ncbi:MAG TPA: hypothetical protein VIV56_05405 [Gemmatimonadales bacterium]
MLLIWTALSTGVGTDSAWGLSSADGGAPVAESDVAECGKREAIAAAIAKLDSARATGTPLNELIRQLAEIEKRMLELQPAAGGTCRNDLSIVGLGERFDPIREALVSERRHQEISRKSWSEQVKQAVLDKRVEIGMTREQVTAAWGEPRNVATTPITRQEQWTYPGPTYLYFTDGVVATIARSRRPSD